MSMQIVNLIQGTPEWHAHRAKYRNASDAPVMMACSPNEHRRELVARLATGVQRVLPLCTRAHLGQRARF